MFQWFSKRADSFRYALSGIRQLFPGQVNIRIHLFAAVLVVVMGFFFGITTGEWLAIILSIAVVMGAEAFNTALEKLTDLVSPEVDVKAGQVKDLAAAAVLIVSMGALLVGLVVFIPYFLQLFRYE